jgi:cystathionine gamma-synthase
MSLVSLPPLGHRVPNVPHAVSVQLPKWQDMVDFAYGNSRVQSVQKSGYPRSFLHKDVQRVNDHMPVPVYITKNRG